MKRCDTLLVFGISTVFRYCNLTKLFEYDTINNTTSYLSLNTRVYIVINISRISCYKHDTFDTIWLRIVTYFHVLLIFSSIIFMYV